jgi:transposase
MGGFLTDEQVVDLKHVHKTLKDKKIADRLKAVLYMHYGLDYGQIAKLLMFDELTVRRYVKQYQEHGQTGLLERRYVGGKCRLTTIQTQALITYVQTQTPHTAKQVVDYIQHTYSMTYSVIGVTKLLHRLGFVYKKPKVFPGKADSMKQSAFIDQYHQIKRQLQRNDRLYFADATHPAHNTNLTYGWILKGKQNDKYIKTNTGRNRLNLNGAFNFQDQTSIILEENTINAQSIITLLEAIKQKQKTGKVYIVLDNAKYHHARLVKQWLLHHPRFRFLFLPPYSPNLNLIERLWKFFHQHIANTYFETFVEFKSTALAFFKNLKQYKDQLTTLMTDNFQTVPNLNIQN